MDGQRQLILFLLDNSGSMDAGFGVVAETADRAVEAVDHFLGGALGSVLGGAARGLAREAIRNAVSKVNVLNVAFNRAFVYLKACRNTPQELLINAVQDEVCIFALTGQCPFLSLTKSVD